MIDDAAVTERMFTIEEFYWKSENIEADLALGLLAINKTVDLVWTLVGDLYFSEEVDTSLRVADRGINVFFESLKNFFNFEDVFTSIGYFHLDFIVLL